MESRAPSVTVTPLRVTRAHFTNYCYLVCDELSGDAVAIDPAWEMQKIEAALSQRGCVLRGILLTHSHHDHVDLAAELSERHRCFAYMSEEEAGFYRFDCQNLVRFRPELQLAIGALRVLPIDAPGHTKGGICYLVGDDLFTGDTLFAEGCGMCVGRGADAATLFRTLQALKSRLPGHIRIFPGHSYGQPPGQPFASLRQTNLYLAFERAEQFVNFRMRKGQQRLLDFK